MTAPVTVLNNLVDRWASLGGFISAHTGDPGTTGANEVTATGYERLATTFPAAADGSTTGSLTKLPIPAGVNGITHVCLRTTKTATGAASVIDVAVLYRRNAAGQLVKADNTLVGAGESPVAAPESFGSAGTLDVLYTLQVGASSVVV